MAIHPTAQVAADATIGDDVEIGPYSVIGPRVRLARGTHVGAHVVIEGDTHIGEGCHIFPFAVLGTLPQDKKLPTEEDAIVGRLRVGARNTIREHVTIHGGTPYGSGETTVGDDNMLLIGSHIGHDSRVGNDCIFTNGSMAAGHTVIHDKVILGAMVGVHQFARVGEMAMVGAGSMLSHDAPPFALVQGDRARLIGVNLVGLKRNGIADQNSANIKRVFRMLFWRTGQLADRLHAVRDSEVVDDPMVRQIVEFVAATRRGVCMPRGRRILFGEEKAEES